LVSVIPMMHLVWHFCFVAAAGQEVTHFPEISCLLIPELNANRLNIMLTL